MYAQKVSSLDVGLDELEKEPKNVPELSEALDSKIYG